MHLQICILASALLAAAGREASAAMDRINLLRTVIATVHAAADLSAAYRSYSSFCQKRVGNMEDRYISLLVKILCRVSISGWQPMAARLALTMNLQTVK